MKDSYLREYAELQRWHWWFRGRRAIVDAAIASAVSGNATSFDVISLGCGPPSRLDWLRKWTDEEGLLIGLDRHHGYGEESGAVRFIVGSIDQVPSVDGRFDLVLLLDVLEHLDDDASGLREAARLVGSGGVLLATVPALPSLWGPHDEVNDHERRYVRRSFAALFSDVGLRDVQIRYFNFLLFPPIAALRWGRRLFGTSPEQKTDFHGSRPGALNEVLARIFAFERHLLGRIPVPVGVSLMGVWKRQ